MKAVDSSVVIAAFASWHELHGAATRSLDDRPRLIAHAALEAYSVLTRLPPPHRAPAPLVSEFLADRFTELPLTLAVEQYRPLIDELVAAGVSGARTYDAFIAVVARDVDATLVTGDRRAAPTYELIGARVEFLG